MIKKFNLLFLSSSILFLAFTVNAQVSFKAETDAAKVLSNGSFSVSFTLRNADGSHFIAPRFRNFNVIAGPNQSSRTTINNSRRSQSATISYTLQPKRLGRLTIGIAKITANGKVLRTRPLAIEVIEAEVSKSDGSDDVFLEVKINHTSAYLGQQLVLDYIFHYSIDIQGMNAVQESSYEGFYSREVHEFNKQAVSEVINGKKYLSQTIKRIVLYPQQTGRITIEPLSISVGIPEAGQTRSRSIFNRIKVRKMPVMSKELVIDVKSLPTPQPDDFSDITGNYRIQLLINKKKLTTDEALSVRLSLIGEGDLKRVQAPDLKFPNVFDVYDPKILKEEYTDKQLTIEGSKTFEYILVPKKAGRFMIQPKLVIFNPDSNIYQPLLSRPIEVIVTQGKGNIQSGLVAEADKTSALFDIRKDIQLYSKSSGFIGTFLFWLLFIGPLLLAGGIGYYGYQQENKPNIDPVLLKQQQARKKAIKRLDSAKQFMHNDKSKAFFNEVEDALLGYITDKLQMPRADLTKANVQVKLALLGANETQTNQFSTLIQNCEMSLYAGLDNTHAMAETYEQSLALLAEMEEVLG